MASPVRTRKGLQDIRTLSGASGAAVRSTRAYARLSALAMELERREHEEETSAARAEVARRRARSIERDIGAILDQLRDRAGDSAPTGRPAPPVNIRYGAGGRAAANRQETRPS